jgi:molecular chaperone DnaK
MAVFAAEKMLKESGDKIEPGDKTKIEGAGAEVRKALAEDKLDDIKKAMDALTEVVYSATTKMYQKIQAEQASKQQAADPSSGAGPHSEKQDDNVVNADYKVKEE